MKNDANDIARTNGSDALRQAIDAGRQFLEKSLNKPLVISSIEEIDSSDYGTNDAADEAPPIADQHRLTARHPTDQQKSLGRRPGLPGPRQSRCLAVWLRSMRFRCSSCPTRFRRG
jgi:hypothetical protein